MTINSLALASLKKRLTALSLVHSWPALMATGLILFITLNSIADSSNHQRILLVRLVVHFTVVAHPHHP